MYRKLLFTFVMAVMLCSQAFPQSDASAAHRADWFREARFGMFVHWGLYSILGGTYNGHTMPDKSFPNGNSWYAEWIQQRLEVPPAEYRKLVQQFNPVHFDADKWISEAAMAGMKYFVITAKHHDGFALWDSKVSTYDLGSTPCKRDLLGELAKACRKYGLKFGFYYSHWQDWEYPGGAWPSFSKVKVTSEAFDQYWHKKCLPQVKELIERYHPDLFWFDTWGDDIEKIHITPERRDELIGMIRKLSPQCLINGRILYSNPGDDIDFLEMGDNSYPDKLLEKPWQTPATMVHSWGWHANDHAWKPANEMLGFLMSNISKGGNYLLNIGPRPDGIIPVAAIGRLRQMGGWLIANSEAVYGAGPVKMPSPAGVVLTQKKDVIYATILRPQPENQVELGIPVEKITSCSILDTALPVKFEGTGNGVKLRVPEGEGIRVVRINIRP